MSHLLMILKMAGLMLLDALPPRRWEMTYQCPHCRRERATQHPSFWCARCSLVSWLRP